MSELCVQCENELNENINGRNTDIIRPLSAAFHERHDTEVIRVNEAELRVGHRKIWLSYAKLCVDCRRRLEGNGMFLEWRPNENRTRATPRRETTPRPQTTPLQRSRPQRPPPPPAQEQPPPQRPSPVIETTDGSTNTNVPQEQEVQTDVIGTSETGQGDRNVVYQIPSDWESNDYGLREIELSTEDGMFHSLKKKFVTSFMAKNKTAKKKPEVTKICRIESLYLLLKYLNKLEWLTAMREDNAKNPMERLREDNDKNPMERELWNCCKPEYTPFINHNGFSNAIIEEKKEEGDKLVFSTEAFDEEFKTKNNAKDRKKTPETNPNGIQRCMYLADVITGNFKVVKPEEDFDMVSAPVVPGKEFVTYDSVVTTNVKGRYVQFQVYDADQAMPKYLIYYTAFKK